jgi:hypothetical protein
MHGESDQFEISEIVIDQLEPGTEVLDFRNRTVRGDVIIDIPRDRDFPRLLLDGMNIHGSAILRGGSRREGEPPLSGQAQVLARGIRIERSLLIEGVDVDGINLNNANIGGDLRITASRFRGHASSRDALRGRDLKVAGSIMIRGSADARSEIEGRIFLAGAEVGGTLEFSGIDMKASDDERRALTLANATIGGDVTWVAKKARGGACTLNGKVKLDSAHIGGRLRLAIIGDDAHVSMRACEIDAALQIYTQTDPLGAPIGSLHIDAGDACMDAILLHGYDHPSWTLDVRGTHYDGLAGLSESDTLTTRAPVQKRAVLAFFHEFVVKPSADGRGHFSPQPYQRYIRLCREEGYNDEADLAVAEWIAIVPKTGGFTKGLYRGFGMLSHYGLRPWRATWTYLVAVLICAAAIGWAQLSAPGIFVDPQLEGNLIAGSAERAAAAPGTPAGARPLQLKFVNSPPDATFDCARRLNPLVYALDVMLPVAAFGQEAQCPLRGRASGPWFADTAFWASLAFALFRIAGTIMLALAVLTFSGINRRIWQ